MFFKIETVEYVPKTGFYWAFEADSREDAIAKIESGQFTPTHFFERNGNSIEIEVRKIEDVTKRVEEIIKENRDFEEGL